jgi:transposase
MSLRGIDAAMTIESAADPEVFKGYVEQALRPKPRPGDVAILDNLPAHGHGG